MCVAAREMGCNCLPTIRLLQSEGCQTFKTKVLIELHFFDPNL